MLPTPATEVAACSGGDMPARKGKCGIFYYGVCVRIQVLLKGAKLIKLDEAEMMKTMQETTRFSVTGSLVLDSLGASIYVASWNNLRDSHKFPSIQHSPLYVQLSSYSACDN
jgi:hypothetical protein